jgi:beta-lactamase regulating signal transducer with metallopeptidase domain
MLIRWMMRFVILSRFIQTCPGLSAKQTETLTRRIPAELLTVGGRKVEFRICSDEFAPFCYQFHQPIVFLPKGLLESEPEVHGSVLHHELTHLHTNHPMQLFLQKLVQCLLWFHPLVWMSAHRAYLTREFVCDEASANFAGSTTAYLKALVTVAEDMLKQQEGTLAISHSKRDLLARVRRLAKPCQPDSPAKSYGSTAMVMVTGLLCSQLWLPINPLSSDRSAWSPWPSWSAEALHAMNVSVRDYEVFSHGNQLHEWIDASIKFESQSPDPRINQEEASP